MEESLYIIYIYKESIWKNIHKVLRVLSPSNGIMRGFILFCFVFVLLFLSSNISTMNMISHVIKNVKHRLHCDCNTGSLLFPPTNCLLAPIAKEKPRCPCHLLNSENTQFFGIKYESIQRESCERKYVCGVLTPPPLLLCP